MENEFYTWLAQVPGNVLTVKIATEYRNGEALYTHDEVVKLYNAILKTASRNGVNRVLITAHCGCLYVFEEHEHFPYKQCDTHWVVGVLNGNDLYE